MHHLTVGQVIAIPVLTRHVKTSSGKCSNPEGVENYSSNCIMADALRDRLADVTGVRVSGSQSDVDLEGGVFIELANGKDMTKAINAFDSLIEEVVLGTVPLKDVMRTLRERIPRVVHATVKYVSN